MTELTLEVESRQLIKKKMGQRIRKEMWDDMEVKGKAIKVRTLLLSTNKLRNLCHCSVTREFDRI